MAALIPSHTNQVASSRGPGRARHPKPLVMGKVTLSRNVTFINYILHGNGVIELSP